MKVKRIGVVLLFVFCAIRAPFLWAGGQYVEVSTVADVPVERAWEILSDFSLAHNYVPKLTKTEIVSEQKMGIGAHRRVYDEDGDFLEETIIEWMDGVGFVIKLHQGDETMTPFDRAEFSYRLLPVGEQTAITLRMTIELPFGVAGEKLGEWIILPVMEDNLVQVAAGMKHFYETGTPATDADRERLAGAVKVSPVSSQVP